MSNQTAIIFGAGGQDGVYLTRLLQQKGINVAGVARNSAAIQGDVGDAKFVENIIRKYSPEYVFHLAAVSSTQHKFILEHQNTICNGVLYILESVKKYSMHSKVFLSGSALQFRNEGMPINEYNAFEAHDYYSVCRIHSTYAARYYRSLGLEVYIGYFFNHDSPFRSQNHMSQRIVTALINIADGSNEKITIGDISVKKEWGYAGDIVQGIWTLIEQSQHFEAVIGTGKAWSIEDWLTICFESKGLTWRNYVLKDESYLSPYQVLVSDPSLINSLGWKSETSIEQLAKMMINFRENGR